MKSIADFKRRMVVGAKVSTLLYYKDQDGNLQLQHNYGIRTVTVHQSNSFALATPKTNGEVVNSWCNWPKKSEFKVIDSNTVEIHFDSGKLVYSFVEN
jgi:hypothetical protein